MKVLTVDDNPDNLALMSDIVAGLGYTVLKAMDGLQALAIVANETPDLILLDVNMPGMSGFEVIKELKKQETTASIPVILLTAMADVEYRVEGIDLGAEDYLTKPYSPRELIARVERRLQSKTQTDNLREMQRQIRETFERFVSPSIVHKMLQDPASVELGGKLQEITVLFADIENFTPISERTDPVKLLTVLNQYHELIVRIIQGHQGTVDKFIGDAVMAIYNTPVEVPDHALAAVRSAYYIREALAEFHTQLEPEFRLPINFGIHTGVAVVGNVGAPHIMNFTAVGDTVNVAARLQSLSHGGQILISETTYQAVAPRITAEAIGLSTIRGRTGQVSTYEITGLHS